MVHIESTQFWHWATRRFPAAFAVCTLLLCLVLLGSAGAQEATADDVPPDLPATEDGIAAIARERQQPLFLFFQTPY